MVTQLDEERRRLWELAKANLEKAHKRYKDFADKSRREVKFQLGDEVWLNIKNFRLPEGLSHKFLCRNPSLGLATKARGLAREWAKRKEARELRQEEAWESHHILSGVLESVSVRE
jgi:hypothetical protein